MINHLITHKLVSNSVGKLEKNRADVYKAFKWRGWQAKLGL
jgi:hypothetical protein